MFGLVAKIISFETPEKYFLRNTEELVRQLKKNGMTAERQESIISQIQEYLKYYEERLPSYLDDITEHLERIVKKEMDEYEQQIVMDELIVYYELLRAPVSPKIFYEMVEANFSGVYDYPQMTEDVLLAIIKEITENQMTEELQQKQQPEHLQGEEEEFVFLFSSPFALRRLFWLTLVNMRNATEQILLEIIQNARLEISDFYDLAQNIVVAGNTTEKVLLALLQRIQQTCWKKEKRNYEILREKLCNFILLEGNLTVEVVKKLLELAQPKREYYSFYYFILRKYGKNLEIRKQLNKILIRDEKNMGKKYQNSRKKLRFLLGNGAYS